MLNWSTHTASHYYLDLDSQVKFRSCMNRIDSVSIIVIKPQTMGWLERVAVLSIKAWARHRYRSRLWSPPTAYCILQIYNGILIVCLNTVLPVPWPLSCVSYSFVLVYMWALRGVGYLVSAYMYYICQHLFFSFMSATCPLWWDSCWAIRSCFLWMRLWAAYQ